MLSDWLLKMLGRTSAEKQGMLLIFNKSERQLTAGVLEKDQKHTKS